MEAQAKHAEARINSSNLSEAQKKAEIQKVKDNLTKFKSQGNKAISDGVDKQFEAKITKAMQAGSWLQSAGSQLGMFNKQQSVAGTGNQRIGGRVRHLQRARLR